MTRLRHCVLVLLSAIAALLILNTEIVAPVNAGPAPAPQPLQNPTRALRCELSPEEKRGKAFYLRGESSSGQEITAMMGEIDVPASTLTCAGCHGARGEGKTEGGVTAGNLTWSHLTKLYGHNHEGGRKHPAFSETSFTRVLTSGLDPAGNKLAVAMQRYRMPQQDMADLIASFEKDRD
jgi:cytochrome c553